jgi:FixJ family two-component response regulator
MVSALLRQVVEVSIVSVRAGASRAAGGLAAVAAASHACRSLLQPGEVVKAIGTGVKPQTDATDAAGVCNLTDKHPVIFIIDDDPSMRATLEDVMRSVGLAVQTFASAEDFRGSKLPDAPACLVLDVRLPGQNGLDLHRTLRESGIELPVVFISGHGDMQMSARAMKEGAVDFLAKPFRDQDLLDAVHEGIERARRGRAVKAAELRERYRSLNERERDIMAFVVVGHPNKQIAAKLGLAELTVKAHRRQIMHKMRARSLRELVRMAGRLRDTPDKD